MDTLQLAAAARCLDHQIAQQVIQGISDAPGGIYLHTAKTHIALIVQRAPLGLWQDTAFHKPDALTTWSSPLNQRLAGFRIQRISVPWADRIVRLDCIRVHISKRLDQFSLIAECFGGRGNIALLDAAQHIRWAWRWDSLDGKAAPRFLPGVVYVPPEDSLPFAQPLPCAATWFRRVAPRYRPQHRAEQQAIQEAWSRRLDPCAPWWRSSAEADKPILYPVPLPGWAPMQEISAQEALRFARPAVHPQPSAQERARTQQRLHLQRRIQKNAPGYNALEGPGGLSHSSLRPFCPARRDALRHAHQRPGPHQRRRCNTHYYRDAGQVAAPAGAVVYAAGTTQSARATRNRHPPARDGTVAARPYGSDERRTDRTGNRIINTRRPDTRKIREERKTDG
jgi:Predicted RNA-binding protein homologous to eukaryotic snRNP